MYESQHYEDFASIKGWKSFFILIPIYQKIVYKRKECDTKSKKREIIEQKQNEEDTTCPQNLDNR